MSAGTGRGNRKVYVHPLVKTRLLKIKLSREKGDGQRTAALAEAVQGLQREVRERKKVEIALRRSEKRQRNLVHQYMAWQENERRLLAQEIHDSIGGSLVTIKYALEEKLETMQGAPPSETVSIERIIDLVQGMVGDTRRLAAKLRPAVLDDLGLTCAIESLCRDYAQFHNICVTYDIGLDDSDVPEGAQIVIYRILQEAMANAAKHSGAECLMVELKRAKEIELSISDNGCGFDPAGVVAEAGSLGGYGLRGMKERALISGGVLAIDSRPGSGTRIRLRLPDMPDHHPGAAEPGGPPSRKQGIAGPESVELTPCKRPFRAEH
jgi:signal transduction histidine kinase